MISSSSSFSSQLDPPFQIQATRVTVNPPDQPTHRLPQKFHQLGFTRKPKQPVSPVLFSKVSDKPPIVLLRESVVPFAASIAILLSSNPAKAGFLSGFSGIESVPGPQLPSIEFLNRFNEENQKKYAEADARFKESPLLKKLLERSQLNKEKNRQEILDKYCLRGAEWGVGDCSTEGMTPDERDNFIATLKQKAGVE